ncbi:uncharacterized protein LOC144711653 [Wolffia australiana]
MEAASDCAAIAMSTLVLEEKVVNFVEEEEINQTVPQESVRSGICAICLDKIALQETALVKGCEHSYCVTCILRWASYNSKQPTCPQCKLPFEFLVVHRTLDGCIRDYMFDESVCLLLRAQWFVPLSVPADGVLTADEDLSHYQYDVDFDEEYDDHDEDEVENYYISSRISTLLIRNRRWGENGYIRGGRKQARPVNPLPHSVVSPGSSSSSASYKGKATATVVGSKAPATMSRMAEPKVLVGVTVTGEEASEVQTATAGMTETKMPVGLAGPEASKASVLAAAAGRRAKRTMKREAADKVAAAKHKQRLERLGRV